MSPVCRTWGKLEESLGEDVGKIGGERLEKTWGSLEKRRGEDWRETWGILEKGL